MINGGCLEAGDVLVVRKLDRLGRDAIAAWWGCRSFGSARRQGALPAARRRCQTPHHECPGGRRRSNDDLLIERTRCGLQRKVKKSGRRAAPTEEQRAAVQATDGSQRDRVSAGPSIQP
jgi:hypothetical protein